jgi:predicted nucleic-acid-binding Zn-ribbon protein
LGSHILEIDFNKVENDSKALSEQKNKDKSIKVRAIISCLNCGTKNIFKNQFREKDSELMVVSLKVFDWLTCSKCGDLLKLDLEFEL